MAQLLSLFVVLAGLGAAQGAEPTIEMLRANAQARMRQDLAIYPADDLRGFEALDQSANKNSQITRGCTRRRGSQEPLRAGGGAGAEPERRQPPGHRGSNGVGT